MLRAPWLVGAIEMKLIIDKTDQLAGTPRNLEKGTPKPLMFEKDPQVRVTNFHVDANSLLHVSNYTKFWCIWSIIICASSWILHNSTLKSPVTVAQGTPSSDDDKEGLFSIGLLESKSSESNSLMSE